MQRKIFSFFDKEDGKKIIIFLDFNQLVSSNPYMQVCMSMKMFSLQMNLFSLVFLLSIFPFRCVLINIHFFTISVHCGLINEQPIFDRLNYIRGLMSCNKVEDFNVAIS